MKKGTEIATIDVVLVTVKSASSDTEIALDTANKINVEINTESTDAVKLIIKGKLKAQKPEVVTVTGNTITLTDNVFNPELVQILQGGTVTYDDSTKAFKKYVPPVAGADSNAEVFELNAYSAIYNAAGLITGYEKMKYPNCQGKPIGLSSEDGTFRAPEYTIISAPDTGEAPYELEIVDSLPVIS